MVKVKYVGLHQTETREASEDEGNDPRPQGLLVHVESGPAFVAFGDTLDVTAEEADEMVNSGQWERMAGGKKKGGGE